MELVFLIFVLNLVVILLRLAAALLLLAMQAAVAVLAPVVRLAGALLEAVAPPLGRALGASRSGSGAAGCGWLGRTSARPRWPAASGSARASSPLQALRKA